MRFTILLIFLCHISIAQVDFAKYMDFAGGSLESSHSSCISSTGAIFIGSSINSSGAKQLLLTKLDSVSNHVWTKKINSNLPYLRSFIVEEGLDSNLILAGSYMPTGASKFQAFLMKIDHHGNILWKKALHLTNTYYNNNVQDMIIHPSGDIIVATNSTQNANWDGRRAYLYRVSPSGQVKWFKKYKNTQLSIDVVDLSLSPIGEIIVGYNYWSPGSIGYDVFGFLRIEPDSGKFIQSKHYYNYSSSDDEAYINQVIALDSNSYLLAGRYWKEFWYNSDGAFVARFDNDTLSWFYHDNFEDYEQQFNSIRLLNDSTVLAIGQEREGYWTNPNSKLDWLIAAKIDIRTGLAYSTQRSLGKYSTTFQEYGNQQVTIKDDKLLLVANSKNRVGPNKGVYLERRSLTDDVLCGNRQDSLLNETWTAFSFWHFTAQTDGFSFPSSLNLTLNPFSLAADTVFCNCQTYEAQPSYEICKGDSVLVFAGVANTYNWSPSTQVSCDTCQYTYLKPSNTGYVQLTLDQGEFCHYDDSISVKVLDTTTVHHTLPDTVLVCGADQISLDLSNFYKVEWFDADTGKLKILDSNYTDAYYQFKYRTLQSCWFTDSFYLKSENAAAYFPFDTVVYCGTNFQVSANGGQTWNWSPAHAVNCSHCEDVVVNDSYEGYISLHSNANLNCERVDSFYFKTALNYILIDTLYFCDTLLFKGPNQQYQISSDSTISLHYKTVWNCDSLVDLHFIETTVNAKLAHTDSGLYSVNWGTQYQWYDCILGTKVLGATNRLFVPDYASQYALKLWTDSCSEMSACVTFTALGEEESLEQRIYILPSPSEDRVKVVGISSRQEYLLYDLQGALVLSGSIDPEGIIDLSNMKAGQYLLKIEGKVLHLIKH